MSKQGRKFDSGKLRYDLIPVLAQEEVVKVVTLGAEKYDPENWKRVPEGRRRYYAAAMRHIEAWRKGEKQDEIGTHHIANAISNLMFILEKELQGIEDVTEESPKDSSANTDIGSPVERWYPDDSGEWVEYDGSGQPVEDDVLVEVLMAVEHRVRGYTTRIRKAEDRSWGSNLYDPDSDIVAYKVVKQ